MRIIKIQDGYGQPIKLDVDRYPRLRTASWSDLQRYRILGDNEIVSWQGLDEDLSIKGLVEEQIAREAGELTDA